MPDTEESVLLKQATVGNMLAYSKLIDRYKSRAYTLALGIVKIPEDAEEVTQDAFLKAFNALSKFNYESSFSTWLYRIVYNTALTRIKKKKVDTTPLASEHIEISDWGTGASQLEAADRKKYVNYVLGQLPREEALMVDLFYVHDKDMREIGTIMSISHGNVRVRLLRIRKKLYTLLQGVLKDELKNIV